MSDTKHITTLEKTFPLEMNAHSTCHMYYQQYQITEGQGTIQYQLTHSLLDGGITNVGKVRGCTTNGYVANSSSRYMTLTNSLALNMAVGDTPIVFYTYGKTIPFSILRPSGTSSMSYTVNFKDSAKKTISTKHIFQDIHKVRIQTWLTIQ